jgi:uncharacterized membrane protein
MSEGSRWIAFCTFVALALRLFRLGHQSFHIDELISIESAGYAVGATFWKGLLHEIHGPLTSALLHGWMRLGETETWLRLLYVVPSVLTVPLFYRLGRGLAGDATGRIASFAVAISPFQVWYGQEVRNYAWLLLFVTGALIAFVRIWDGRGDRSTWIALTSLLALSLLTNYSTVFLIVALTVLVLARKDRAVIVRWFPTTVALALLFLPWFLDWYTRVDAERFFVDRPRRFGVPLRNPGEFTLSGVPYLFWVFAFGYSLGPSAAELHLDQSLAVLREHGPVLVAGALAVGFALVVGLREAAHPRRTTFLAVTFLVPLALTVILSIRDVKAFNVRYAMVAYPPFVMLLALGWSRRGLARNVSALAALALAILSLASHYFNTRYAKEDMRSAARLILEREQPGDTVVVIDNLQPFRYYFARRGNGRAPLLHRHKRFLRTQEDLAAHVEDAMRSEGREWLVLSRWWEVAPKDVLYRAFDARLERRGTWIFPGVDVTLYERATSRRLGAANPPDSVRTDELPAAP